MVTPVIGRQTEPCSGCGEPLSWYADLQADEYRWADAEGRTEVPTGLPHPLTVAYEIGQRILAATTGPKRKRGPMPTDAECGYYSVIINSPYAFGRPHVHVHDRQPLHGHGLGPDDLPWCCDWPMRLRPSGWHCRARCGAVRPLLSIATAGEAPTPRRGRAVGGQVGRGE